MPCNDDRKVDLISSSLRQVGLLSFICCGLLLFLPLRWAMSLSAVAVTVWLRPTLQKMWENRESQVGFSRSEVGSEPLTFAKKIFTMHVFVGTGTDQWPTKFEKSDLGILIRAAKNIAIPDNTISLVVTATDAPLGEVIVFPDSVLYRVPVPIQQKDLTLIFKAHASMSAELISAATDHFQSEEAGPSIFSCSHASRDARCGHCGPILVKAFRAEISKRDISARVYKCSHIGGHKFAGCVLIYSTRPSLVDKRKLCGDWYGYVKPSHVPQLVSALQSGLILPDLWRGCMGLESDEIDTERSAAIEASCGGCAPDW